MKIILFNLAGVEVKEILNLEQDKGFHAVRLSANNLASGVYYYRIQFNGFFKQGKLILIK
ncbi:MAG: hypothetical protein EXR24_04675 [Ignavibacteria bacterium]|nr:hypothetical protein [Ignavibacteria bacterium]